MKRLAAHTAAVMATILILVAFWQFRNGVILFVFSLFVAAAIRPLVAQLVSYRVPANIAQVLVYGVFALLVAAFFYFASTTLLNELGQLAEALREKYQEFYLANLGGTESQQNLAQRLPAASTLYEVNFENSTGAVNAVLGFTQSIANGIGGILLVIVLSVYWSMDQARFERLLLSLLPADRRIRARNAWRDIEAVIGSYLRSRFVQSALIGLVLWVTYWLVGMPYPTLLMLVAAIGKLIPLAGSFIAISLVFIAGLTRDTSFALGMASLTTALWFLLKFGIEPQISREHRFSSLLVIMTAIPFFQAFGLLGFVLAPPFAAAIQLILTYLFAEVTDRVPADSTAQIEGLEQRLDEVRRVFENGSEDKIYPPEIGSILDRLSAVVNKAKSQAN